MQELAQWRAEVQASVPDETAKPAEVLVDEVPDSWTEEVATLHRPDRKSVV